MTDLIHKTRGKDGSTLHVGRFDVSFKSNIRQMTTSKKNGIVHHIYCDESCILACNIYFWTSNKPIE